MYCVHCHQLGPDAKVSGRNTYLPFQRAKTYVFFKPARAPGTLIIGRRWGPRTPQISSNSRRKSLMFEAGVGDRLATLKVSREKR